MQRLTKVAIACGGTPLVVGTLVYVTWRFTRWDGFISAGITTIGVGLLGFIVGVVCLVRQPWNADGDLSTRRHHRRGGFFALGLLLINFPAAAFYTLSAIDIETRYTVRVHNDSNQPIDSVVVTGPGARSELGPIAPGRRVQRNFRFRGEGTLDFTARQRELHFGGQLEGYVTGGLGGELTIRVRQGGVYELQPRRTRRASQSRLASQCLPCSIGQAWPR